jgi:hypothetical protein
MRKFRPLPRLLFSFAFLLLLANAARAQSPQPVCTPNAPPPAKLEAAPADTTAGIRIAVTGVDGKPLQRKRFYLLQRNVVKDSNFNPATAPKRDQFLAGASPELRAWLKKHECESLYCPDYEATYEDAIKTVPEFKQAYDAGMKKYNNQKLALQWVTVNFPLKNVRTEFYKRKKAWLDQVAQMGGRVASVMTDEKGVAYFTDIKLGTYYVSNLIPLEDSNILWSCEVTVPPPIPRQLYSVSFTLRAEK